MSITTDFINNLRGKGHTVVDRRGKANGGNNHNRSLAGLTKGGQHWDGVANGTIEGHERYWRNSLGWRDGGYTAFVEDNGKINVNYDFEKRTNGVGNHNTPTLNFCYGGDWSNPLTEAQKVSLTDMWTFVVNDKRTNINSFNDILGHKEFPGHSDNACPGLNMNDFRKDISNGTSSKTVNAPEPKQAQGAKLVKYEDGKFTVTDPLGIKVRNAPSTKATHTNSLAQGDSIDYDRVYEGNGYRWLAYFDSGKRRYVPYRPSNDINNQWGVFGKQDNTKKLHLPESADLWRIYNVNGPYTVNDEIHFLTPSAFPGGITYDILDEKGGHVYVINTGVKGRVAIYAGPETGAVIK